MAFLVLVFLFNFGFYCGTRYHTQGLMHASKYATTELHTRCLFFFPFLSLYIIFHRSCNGVYSPKQEVFVWGEHS